jgi:hypothetical protein
LDDNDVKYIAKAIYLNRNLKRLYLGANKITSKGAEYLIESMKYNTTITLLDVSYNKISLKINENRDILNCVDELNRLTTENKKNPEQAQKRLIKNLPEWTKEVHFKFLKSFQDAVYCYVLILKRNEKKTKFKMPKYIFQTIIRNIDLVTFIPLEVNNILSKKNK